MNNQQKQEMVCELNHKKSKLQIEIDVQQKWIADLVKAIYTTQKEIELIDVEINKLIPPVSGIF